jgi:hypothetical protein
MPVKLIKLSKAQTLGWCFASAVYGVFLLAIGFKEGVLIGAVEWFVFGCAWLIPVILLRKYIQGKDPMDIRSLLGLPRH